MTTGSGLTVRATPQASAAVDELAGLINGPLLTHFNGLRATARVLLEPENWDGRTAAEFRTSIWPAYERTLTDLHTQLDRLRVRLAEIQIDIQAAG
ncbi:hypothetical protein Ga0074812_102137 [Parafrankia irregularis]|uniref:WXG100 family type VII secretion target n=1 Tax=Parafrankia irregularis TaxID=795642 RepID=A0A0S4QF03_9ACTN|nr:MULTISPECIES: hypothetical protein [Parafrankia]EFC85973.1 hypothetical protein FrEUN1fDRAFT_0951 [Parafrankia sp. EUN1f]MBE3203223.1 hypothetical protein [Parafrankia sp. CH37]CUU54133.1 hypothetical protein Ga0074812_102137 [Parafrankia irregularis]